MKLLFLLQSEAMADTAKTMVAVAKDAAKGKDLELWEVIGESWYIMGPLAILSILAVYIFIERMIAIGKAGKVEKDFMNRIKDYLLDGKRDAAVDLCRQADTPVSHMINKGISKMGKPLKEISTSIENVGKLEISKMERGLSTLATVAGAAPMIGFLGTVIGMIRTFHSISTGGSNVKIDQLSGGIMEAMVTTVGGLIIGIIAYIAYNILVTKLNNVIHGLEASSIEFLDVLDAPAN